MDDPNSLASLGSILEGDPAVYPALKGTVRIWEPAPRIVVTHVTGMLTGEGASAIELAVRRVVANHGRVLGFHDWEAMTDYETAARTRLVQLGVELFRVTDVVHILSASKIVQLAVRGASMVVRSIKMQPDRLSFESALRSALAGSRG